MGRGKYFSELKFLLAESIVHTFFDVIPYFELKPDDNVWYHVFRHGPVRAYERDDMSDGRSSESFSDVSLYNDEEGCRTFEHESVFS